MSAIPDVLTNKLHLQKGVITVINQDGTIVIEDFKTKESIVCFIIRNTNESTMVYNIHDEVCFVADEHEATGYIIGIIDRYIPVKVPEESIVSKHDQSKPKQHIEISGSKSVCIKASDEIRFQCGKGSVLITKQGKIVLQGTNLVSRSSGANKLKGGSVSIN